MKRTTLRRKTPLRQTSSLKRHAKPRYESDSARHRRLEAKPLRDGLRASVGLCECCGTSPRRPKWPIREQNELHCHEILNGPLRQKVLNEPSCLIVACNHCNQGCLHDKGEYPLSRQLSIIKQRAPERYDLQRVLWLRNPNAMQFVTEAEVDAWL